MSERRCQREEDNKRSITRVCNLLRKMVMKNGHVRDGEGRSCRPATRRETVPGACLFLNVRVK